MKHPASRARHFRAPLVLAALLVAAGLSTCAHSPSDATITAQLTQKLTEEHVPGRISVTTQGGVVTLTGAVPDQDVKERAQVLAMATGGVQDVHNRLETMAGDAPPRPHDVPPPNAPANNPPGGMPPQMAPPGGLNVPLPHSSNFQ